MASWDTAQAPFADRQDAGRQLAERLRPLAAGEQPVVVALPRGGVPVAAEIASALAAQLEFLAVRKLGAPHNPEYGIGAIAEGGTRVFDHEALAVLGIDNRTLESIVLRETSELHRRVGAYRGDRPTCRLCDRLVIVVDDGVATGVTDTAALRDIRALRPRHLVLAVPVCPPDSAARLRAEADEVVCLLEPALLYGVGQWYRDFDQVSDDEVIATLFAEADGRPGERGKAAASRRVPAVESDPGRP
ncbi:MAG TPA: phosphoribosyltransferase family protein [Solirubrobacterales bacterium]|nr:phosphoribosyltransferase family protein [Solirubrobacterales bacterium]